MSSSKAVNVPVDMKQKEADVNTKLQLYGIFEAFSNGKAPSNKQIDVALNSALASRSLSSPSKRLSPEGQKLVADLKDVIEQAKVLLLTKNDGNLLQDFIWQTQQLTGGNAAVPGAPVDKDTARQHGNEALEGLRTLGTLILSNGQFRKLLSDATILLRDIAGDAATKTANKVNPSDHQLNQIDHPAEDNTWHEVPDLSRDNLKSQAQQRSPFSKGDAKKVAGDATQAAHPQGSRDPADVGRAGAEEQLQGQQQGIDARAGIQTAKQAINENISEEDKDRAREVRDARRQQLNNYLRGKMPEERRDQTIWRLKKMVVEIQGHQDYQQAIDTLLRLAEQYAGHGKNVAGQSHGAVKGAHDDDALQLAEADLKTLLERFANSTSFDDAVDAINQIYRDADQDPQLRNWFKRLDTYVRKILKEQGYILEDRSNEEWNQIYDEGHYLLRDRYRGHTDRVADEFKFLGEQFDADPYNKRFASSVNKLFLDLGNDENGQTTFKPHLVKDLTEVILPAFFESVRYVPIPRIEYSDPMVDAVVENLVIEGDNLAPNVLEFGSDNYWRWGRKQISSRNKNKIMLSVSGIQMDLRDVAYYVKKKQGFPSVTDKGVMDVFMGGSGFSFKVELETADKDDKIHYFKINKVSSDIQNLQIKVKKSNHKLLFSMFKPLLLKVMRPVIQRVLEKQIKDNVNQLDAIIFDIKREADRAAEDAKRNPDPENIQNIYQRYATAANQRIMQGKQKKAQLEERAKDTHVNVAVTQHDSMFKNISLPGGISTKATEYKELAGKGDKWESPVFSIGSSKESTSLPKLAAVSRKPHGRSGGYGLTDTTTHGGNYGQSGTGAGQGFDGTGYGSGTGAGYGQGSTGQGLAGHGLTGQGAPTGQGLSGHGLTGQGAPTGQGLSGHGLTGQGAPTGQGLSGHGLTGQGAPTGQGFGTQAQALPTHSLPGQHNTGLGATGQPTGTGQFAGQVDNAFNGGNTATGAPGSSEYHTSLGDKNPVFRGDV